MKFSNYLLMLSLVFFISLKSSLAETKSQIWEFKNSWSDPNINWELRYQRFVSQLGNAKEQSKCSNAQNCIMNSYANPDYFFRNPTNLKIYSDCADFPYVLRAYFSWMNDLPFSFVSGVAPASSTESSTQDIRYTKLGNKMTSRYVVKPGVDKFNDVIVRLTNSISSATYRLHAKYEFPKDANGNTNYSSQLFNDFYSPKIDRENIVPGTTVYDPAGHLLVVYKVSDDGNIYMVDAHPNNDPLSIQVYGAMYVRSRPAHGAGFKNWRPIEWDYNSKVLSAKPNSEISGVSFEQFYGNKDSLQDDSKWDRGIFVHDGVEYNTRNADRAEHTYYHYVRKVLANGELTFEPIKEISFLLDNLCENLKFRAEAVDSAFSNGINKQPHPLKLPDNIYGTSGDWENYSTPSRDARFKTGVRELTESAKTFITQFERGDASIHYSGTNLKQDLWNIYVRKAQDPATACFIEYTNSVGSKVKVTLDDIIENRLFKLSFDPYHCIEYRWGATGSELATCPDSSDKKLWYKNEQYLRNSPDRTYDARMNYGVNDLLNSGLGLTTEPIFKFSQILWK